jgi:hypothetical protein
MAKHSQGALNKPVEGPNLFPEHNFFFVSGKEIPKLSTRKSVCFRGCY